MNFSTHEINESIAIYFGIREEYFRLPEYHIANLVKTFGKIRAGSLISKIIKPLEREAISLHGNINWNEHTMDSACILVKKIMHERYPNLSQEALQALAQNFAFTWK